MSGEGVRDYGQEISKLIDEFKERFADGTKGAEGFLSMSEIERMWGELRHHTSELYSDMVMEAMASIDEGALIRKKKPNTDSGESCCVQTEKCSDLF